MKRNALLLEREAHAKAMLAANLTKLARTVTQVKKWERKVRYYEASIRKTIVEEQTVRRGKRAFFLGGD